MTGITRKQKGLAELAERKPKLSNLFPLMNDTEWMRQAMWTVLQNKGAITAGIDGIVKAHYYDAETNSLKPRAIRLIDEFCRELEIG